MMTRLRSRLTPSRTSWQLVPTRGAFTLIELMVVITLIMIMAGLAVMFMPRIGEQDRAARGGAMLQSWLNTARAKALLYKSPVGIRLIPNTDPTLSWQVPQCVYIEQLEDFVGADLTTGSAGNKNFVDIAEDLTTDSIVQAGDYLEVLGSGLLHRLRAPSPFNAGKTNIELDSPIPFSISTGTRNYRIIRGARPFGEELLVLPDQVGIDLGTNDYYTSTVVVLPAHKGLPPPNPDGSVDVLFSPSGAVISRGITTDILYLWVRDISNANSTPPISFFEGDPSIIAVYTKTGQTAAHPASTGSDPYEFVKDGRSSGR